MSTKCAIEFDDNPLNVYYSGQTIRGVVHLNISDAKTVRGIYLKIIGKSYVRWHSNPGRIHRRLSGKDVHLKEIIYFVGGDDGKEINLKHKTPSQKKKKI